MGLYLDSDHIFDSVCPSGYDNNQVMLKVKTIWFNLRERWKICVETTAILLIDGLVPFGQLAAQVFHGQCIARVIS